MQKYDRERDETRAKFDLERDEVQRKFIASMLGVKLGDSSPKPRDTPATEQKQTMTRQDIMRNYSK